MTASASLFDFEADALLDRFRALTVVDNFTKEKPAIEMTQQPKAEDTRDRKMTRVG